MIKFRKETEFKQTEIGDIPREWGVIHLGKSSFNIIMGQSPPSKYYNAESKGMLFIQGRKDFGDLYIEPKTYTEKCNKIAPAQSVLITVRAPVGDINITKNEVCIGRGLASIYSILNNPSLNCFIYYTLRGLRDYIMSLGERGTTYEEIIREDLEKLPIPLLPAPEQSRIATVLSWFDDLIENKKKQNEILEKTAMAIFKSWFVDFEPFKDGEFVYSEQLGKEIPKGWGVAKLGTIAEITMGQSPPSKYYNYKGEGLRFIQGKGQFGRYTPNTETYCSNIAKLAKVKDILVTVRAPVGELNIADQEYIIGRGVASLRSEYWAYLYLYLLTNNELLRSFERGTTYDAITKEELESFPLLTPSHLALQKFHSFVEPLFQKIILNQKETMILRKIRDALLPLLVFGKLRVVEI